MTNAANLQRQALVERYTQTTLDVLGRAEVQDRLGDRQPELVALLDTAFTAERHLGRLVMPTEQITQNNVAIHPVLEQDWTIPNHARFINTPSDAGQRPAPDRLWSRAADAVFGLYPRFFDGKNSRYAATTRSETSRRDLIMVFPNLQQVAPIHAAAIIAHEFDHVRTNRWLDQKGSPLSYDDETQIVAGEKAAYGVSEAILEIDNSLSTQMNFDAFWKVVQDAETPAIAVSRAAQLTRELALHHGHVGELAATVYAAKALSLRFGEKDGPPTKAEIEAYKLYGIVHRQV